MFVLAALLEILFEENRAARIGNKNAGCWQENVTGAVLYFDLAPEKG
jgi:hypothetical protein